MTTFPAQWQVNDNRLIREFRFQDFMQAMTFVNQVATLAESHQHHPDIDIRYNTVRLATTTHDADNTITDKDIQLASAVNQMTVIE